MHLEHAGAQICCDQFALARELLGFLTINHANSEMGAREEVLKLFQSQMFLHVLVSNVLWPVEQHKESTDPGLKGDIWFPLERCGTLWSQAEVDWRLQLLPQNIHALLNECGPGVVDRRTSAKSGDDNRGQPFCSTRYDRVVTGSPGSRASQFIELVTDR